MKWGCHSFGGIHAIFSMYDGSSLKTRLEIIKKAITSRGIIGYVYCSKYGESKSIESAIDVMGNYGIVHGSINCEQHNYYRCEVAPLEDEVKTKLELDLKYYEKRKEDITDWYNWHSEQLQLAMNATKFRLENNKEELTQDNSKEFLDSNTQTP
jgi:hypothetical protein